MWLNVCANAVRALLFRARIQHTYFRKRANNFLDRWLFRKRREPGMVTGTLEFDDIDLATLRSAASCGPGFSISAPDIATDLMIQKRAAQQSLDKLLQSNMLDLTLGATDDHDNYRITTAGLTFLSSHAER